MATNWLRKIRNQAKQARKKMKEVTIEVRKVFKGTKEKGYINVSTQLARGREGERDNSTRELTRMKSYNTQY